tara:strand:- start:38 stop:1780 length:1743 start_codon:yes stop_codon:yes gene_type:complete
MCGIFGFYSQNEISDNYIDKLKEVTLKLSHRGPDSHGFYISKDKKIFLGHTRLSVIDLDKRNNQPFIENENILVFNGEIYNFKEIKKQYFKNELFKTTGDTEVLFKVLKNNLSLKILDGMFSFAFLKKNKLLIASDFFAEKNLYYHSNNKGVYFSSEPNNLVDFLGLKEDVNNQKKINQFIKYGFVNQPETLYKELKSLQPANILEIENGKIKLNYRYWKRKKVNINFKKNNYKVFLKNFHTTLISSIESRTVSDIDIGLLLSSGFDSTLIACILKKELNINFKALSIAYTNSNLDESPEIKKIAKFLNIDSIIINEKSTGFKSDLQKFNNINYNINDNLTLLSVLNLCSYAKKYFKVGLSGYGGDEILLGYNRYRILKNALPIINLINKNKILKTIFKNLTFIHNKVNFIVYLSNFSEEDILHAIRNYPFYKNFDFKNNNPKFNFEKIINYFLDYEFNFSLSSSIIPAIENASTAHGMEIRTPYLSRSLINIVNEYGENKVLNLKLKQIQKDLLKIYLPNNLIPKIKKGFIRPITENIFDSETKEYIQRKKYDINNHNVKRLGLRMSLLRMKNFNLNHL